MQRFSCNGYYTEFAQATGFSQSNELLPKEELLIEFDMFSRTNFKAFSPSFPFFR